MAQDIVRNIEIEVKTELKLRAAQHGWSTEEVRQILHSAVRMTKLPQAKLGSRIAKRLLVSVWLSTPHAVSVVF